MLTGAKLRYKVAAAFGSAAPFGTDEETYGLCGYLGRALVTSATQFTISATLVGPEGVSDLLALETVSEG